MRVLIVSVHYPPIVSLSSRTMAGLSDALVKADHQVDILTIDPISGHPQFKTKFSETRRIPKNVNIHRVPMGPINRALARISGYDRTKSGGEVRRMEVSDPRQLPHSALWRKIKSSHTSADWLPAALLEARRMVRHANYDLIVALAGPAICHLLAYLATGARPVRRVMICGESYNWANIQVAKPRVRWRLWEVLKVAALRSADRIIVGAQTFVPYLEDRGIDRHIIEIAEFPKIDLKLVTGPDQAADAYGKIASASAMTAHSS